jgi:clan AA aspartic protease
MITGTIQRRWEAMVQISVGVPGGDELREIEALLDTGFNGSLTLPPTVVEELGLVWRTRSGLFLANGKKERIDVYAADVMWDGTRRRILVDATGTVPLVGMSLLAGYELRIQVVKDGFFGIMALDV